MKLVRITGEIVSEIKNFMNIELNRKTIIYSPFIVHVRFFVMRHRDEIKEDKTIMFDLAAVSDFERSYPKNYLCASAVIDDLIQKYQWIINKSETLYLAIHIERMYRCHK
jgi:transcriptional regulatory protein LevR